MIANIEIEKQKLRESIALKREAIRMLKEANKSYEDINCKECEAIYSFCDSLIQKSEEIFQSYISFRESESNQKRFFEREESLLKIKDSELQRLLKKNSLLQERYESF
jgi:hypothetical protein